MSEVVEVEGWDLGEEEVEAPVGAIGDETADVWALHLASAEERIFAIKARADALRRRLDALHESRRNEIDLWQEAEARRHEARAGLAREVLERHAAEALARKGWKTKQKLYPFGVVVRFRQRSTGRLVVRDPDRWVAWVREHHPQRLRTVTRATTTVDAAPFLDEARADCGPLDPSEREGQRRELADGAAEFVRDPYETTIEVL